MTVTELRLQHPFPWSYAVGPAGNIGVVDAQGKTVPLLTLLDFVCAITRANRPPEGSTP